MVEPARLRTILQCRLRVRLQHTVMAVILKHYVYVFVFICTSIAIIVPSIDFVLLILK